MGTLTKSDNKTLNSAVLLYQFNSNRRRQKMAFTPKADSMELYVNDTVQVVGRKLQAVAQQLKASVKELQSSSGGLAQFDDHADIEVLFEGTNFMGSLGG